MALYPESVIRKSVYSNVSTPNYATTYGNDGWIASLGLPQNEALLNNFKDVFRVYNPEYTDLLKIYKVTDASYFGLLGFGYKHDLYNDVPFFTDETFEYVRRDYHCGNGCYNFGNIKQICAGTYPTCNIGEHAIYAVDEASIVEKCNVALDRRLALLGMWTENARFHTSDTHYTEEERDILTIQTFSDYQQALNYFTSMQGTDSVGTSLISVNVNTKKEYRLVNNPDYTQFSVEEYSTHRIIDRVEINTTNLPMIVELSLFKHNTQGYSHHECTTHIGSASGIEFSETVITAEPYATYSGIVPPRGCAHILPSRYDDGWIFETGTTIFTKHKCIYNE